MPSNHDGYSMLQLTNIVEVIQTLSHDLSMQL